VVARRPPARVRRARRPAGLAGPVVLTRDRERLARLEERLDEVFGKRLTLVVAGAGFGKSTLLAQWARDLTPPGTRSLGPIATSTSSRGGWSAPSASTSVPSKGRVLVMRPDGGGRRTVTQIEGAAIGDVAWSPDGRWLAFVARVVPQD
jgi:hypothetical protein